MWPRYILLECWFMVHTTRGPQLPRCIPADDAVRARLLPSGLPLLGDLGQTGPSRHITRGLLSPPCMPPATKAASAGIPRRHAPHGTGLPRQARARDAEVRAERPQGRPAERIRPP